MNSDSMESYSYNYIEKYTQADMDKKDARIKELEEGREQAKKAGVAPSEKFFKENVQEWLIALDREVLI